MRERGRTEARVRAQFDATAKPMADLYVLPSQERADSFRLRGAGLVNRDRDA